MIPDAEIRANLTKQYDYFISKGYIFYPDEQDSQPLGVEDYIRYYFKNLPVYPYKGLEKLPRTWITM